MTDTALLRLTGLTKVFGGQVALHPLDLSVARGDFVALLGPSGCGKTTLLRMIGGFLPADAGKVEIDGVDVTALGPERRNTNMVFQGYGLFPHMTVRQNVGYGLSIARRPAAERSRDVDAMLDMMHIAQFADRLPAKLSGGQQQRVALARALVMKPKIVLLDEPLAALDLQLRKSMQDELRNLHREIGGTFICVTHDQGEAIALANRIVVLNAGRIMQEGTPEDIYRRPSNVFVAGFVGESNILKATRRSGLCQLGDLLIAAPGPDGEVAMMIRPGDVRFSPARPPDSVGLPGQVTDTIFMGDHVKVVITTATGDKLIVHPSRASLDEHVPAVGSQGFASWSQSDAHIMGLT